MIRIPLICVLLAMGAAGLSPPPDFVRMPDGWLVHKSCIFHHRDGMVNSDDVFPCAHDPISTKAQTQYDGVVYAIDVHCGLNSTRQSGMEVSWVVPADPAVVSGQTVNFFPGLKRDVPNRNYPVLQPVLSWTEGHWIFTALFVDGFHKPMIWHSGRILNVSAGDRLHAVIKVDSNGDSSIVATDLTTGEVSAIKQSAGDMGVSFFQYAMLTVEWGDVLDCPLLPASNITWTDVSVSGTAQPWTTTVRTPECGNDVTVSDDNTLVNMMWHSAGMIV